MTKTTVTTTTREYDEEGKLVKETTTTSEYTWPEPLWQTTPYLPQYPWWQQYLTVTCGPNTTSTGYLADYPEGTQVSYTTGN